MIYSLLLGRVPGLMREINMMPRKAARRRADIPAEILQQLNRGEIETMNLVEGLALDFAVLIHHAVPNVPNSTLKKLKACQLGWMSKTRLTCQLLYEQYGLAIFPELAGHPADNVRGWAAGLLAVSPDLNLKQRLDKLKPLANDRHFGVRETAMLLLRDRIAADPQGAIHYLKTWVQDPSPYLRRFASEVTRPRGVWCKHIELLKTRPDLALPLLQPLRADPERYVQNSVANWLADAAKTQAQWVRSLCDDWRKSGHTATLYICKRALRND